MRYQLENLNKSYGQKEIIKNLSISLPQYGVVCIMGRSGCGKTTLINMIAEGLKEQIAFVFQEDRLLPWLTVEENIDIVTNEWKITNKISKKWLEKFELSAVAKKNIQELSGGMKRRIAIARAMAYDKSIIIMDEPFKGLDKETKDIVLKSILMERQKLFLIVTHDEEEAKTYADEIVLIEETPIRTVQNKI